MNEIIDPLNNLHPFRYLGLRPYHKPILQLYDRLREKLEQDLIDRQQFADQVDAEFRRLYSDYVSTLPENMQEDRGTDVTADLLTFWLYANWRHLGRNIFAFAPELTQKFVFTDVGSVPLSEIRMPYESFYIYFGRQPHLEMTEAVAFIDGAYVTAFEDCKPSLTLTASRLPGDVVTPSDPNRIDDPIIHWALDTVPDQPTISGALEQYKIEIAAIKTHANDLPKEDKFYITEDLAVCYTHNITDPDKFHSLNQLVYTIIQEAIRLVINGIFYITSYPEEVKKQLPSNAPQRLAHLLQQATRDKERHRNKSKLEGLGFSEIFFCNEMQTSEGTHDGQHSRSAHHDEKRIQSPHWRRGHWRKQVHGTGFTERKLLWIKPVMVGRATGSASLVQTPDEFGHVYQTSNSDERKRAVAPPAANEDARQTRSA